MLALPYRPHVILALALLFVGCVETRTVADYDERTDQQVTRLQRQAGHLLLNLERSLGEPGGAFEAFQDRYDALALDLQALLIRAEVRPANDQQVTELVNLREQVARVAGRHRAGQLRAAEIEPIRQILDQSFRAILRLELARKRGED